MKAQNFALQAALVLIFLGPALPLHAQGDLWVGSDLYICNKGTGPVEVVAANKGSGLGKSWWNITTVTKAPGECAIVTNQDENPSYIAFGLSDAKGGMESGTIERCPEPPCQDCRRCSLLAKRGAKQELPTVSSRLIDKI